MLVNLHVKDFAIIDEIDVDFRKHLNILTGETGAGKSILVGSVNIALGARVSADIIRKGANCAMVELVFLIENEETIKTLREMDIFPEDGQVVISRKIMENRSVNKINGENVSVSMIKKVAALCIDIHGQHEHQSLLQKAKHIDIVDEFKKEELAKWKAKMKECYHEYRVVKEDFEKSEIPENERERELSFLQYEKNEIESAGIYAGEEEELEEQYEKFSHGEAIVTALGNVYQLMGEASGGAGDKIGYSIRQISDAVEYDGQVKEFMTQLVEIEGMVNDFNREVSGYIDSFSFDQSQYRELEDRLNIVRSILGRYGGNYDSMMNHLTEIQTKLEKYEDYDAYVQKQKKKIEELEINMNHIALEISKIRTKAAKILEKEIMQALSDLNFADARFNICMNQLIAVTANGIDDVEFMIATNPGEDIKPLAKIASGGELSRIMLAIKSVFAEHDAIETLIFDEIDVGISGRTAQMVSEKMALLGKEHQIICITHLSQIASMADTHFVIEKNVTEDFAHTEIRSLSDEESVEELARILGGAQITEAVLTSAREMKELANQKKNYIV